MRRLYAEGHRVELMSPLDLADEDWVAVVSNMGAPLIGQERLADSRNIARAVEIQEALLGEKFRAVMSLEIGGGNGIQPLMAAAHLDLPVVDADTMGRAYPEAQMRVSRSAICAPTLACSFVIARTSLLPTRKALLRCGRSPGSSVSATFSREAFAE